MRALQFQLLSSAPRELFSSSAQYEYEYEGLSTRARVEAHSYTKSIRFERDGSRARLSTLKEIGPTPRGSAQLWPARSLCLSRLFLASPEATAPRAIEELIAPGFLS